MFVVAKELLGIPGLPATAKGIREALCRFSAGSSEWARKREGTKATEYHIDCLPEQAREIVKTRYYDQLLQQSAPGEVVPAVPARQGVAVKAREELVLMQQCPALTESESGKLTGHQKKVANARCVLAAEINRLRNAGETRVGAIELISERSKLGNLPEHIQAAADMANARKGKRKGVSIRSLQDWYSLYSSTTNSLELLVLLAPGQTKARRPETMPWFKRFQPHYWDSNGPTLKAAYRAFVKEWERDYHDQPAMLAAMPSYDAVNYTMKKLKLHDWVKGRVSGSALAAYEVYQRRDWSTMPVNGVWISDGKSLEMKVKNPITGRAFTPELTMVIDGRTRFVVGWSLSLSESAIAVMDAHRYGMERYGKPLFIYSDNGGGETNKMLDAEITGILPRMGVEHMLSRPGNPQARGIIERLNAVIPLRLARKFATFYGASADPEKVRKVGQRLISLTNAQRSGKELTPVQKQTDSMLPAWRDLIDAIEDEITEYNNSHEHSELPKKNGKHMSPAAYRQLVLEQEGDDIIYPSKAEIREMFMPEEIRTAGRGWIRLSNNFYFSHDLINVDREKVRVAFDIHDAKEVIIRRLDGSHVCTAVWNGNTMSPVEASRMEQQLMKRAQEQIKRAEKRIQDAKDSVERPVIDLKPEIDYSIFNPPVINEEPEKVYISESEYEYDLKKAGNHR